MIAYELPTFTPRELLEVVGVPERTFQVWVQRSYIPCAARHGKGTRRKFSLSDALGVSFLKAASAAHIPLGEASIAAMHIFPALDVLVPPVVLDVIRRSDRPDLAPQVFAVLQDGRDPLVVRQEQLGDVSAGATWFTAIDLSRLISTTVAEAEAALERRAAVI